MRKQIKSQTGIRVAGVILVVSGLILQPISLGQRVEVNAEAASPSKVSESSEIKVIALENGDFEEPYLNVSDLNSYGYALPSASDVPGWETTDYSKSMQMFIGEEGGFPEAASGRQYVELNNEEPGALYQDILTTPGTKVRWTVSHKGRKGVEQAIVEFGAPGGTMTKQAEMSDDTSGWGLYTGEYIIPEGQTTTRFQFRSLTAGNVGNFLDNVQFATQSVLDVKGTFSTPSVKVRNKVDYTIHATNVGGMPAANNTFSVKVPAELTYTPGSLSSTNTAITNESYDAATHVLTFTTGTLKKDASLDITIPLTGAKVTPSATMDTKVTYNDENFNEEHYTAEGTDSAIEVTSNEAPTLTGEKETVLQPNASFDPMSTMKATDKEDGDITAKITVVSNTVDTSKPGTYAVTYEVTDTDGNKTTFTRTVTVTEAPVITGEDTVQVNQGAIFSPLDYVQATDKEDGDVTSQIHVVSNSVNTNQPGEYQVTYEVADSDGNTTRKTITVQVIANGTISANTFTLGKDGYVQGTYTGDVARVALVVDGQTFGKIPPATDGSYKYYAGSKITSTSNHVEMVAYDASGKELDRVDVTVQALAPTSGDITAADYLIGTSYITGTYTGDTARISVRINGKELSKIPATDNTYRYYVGSQIMNLTDKVEVVAYDAKGKELAHTVVPIKQEKGTGTVTADSYLVGGLDKYIHGTVTGDVNYVKLEVNGKLEPSQALVQANKTFQYYTGGLITSTDDNIVLVGYDIQGNEISRTTVILINTQGTVTVEDYFIDGTDKYIHGTTTGDVYRLKVIVNGTFLSSQTYIQPGNVFNYYVGTSAISSASDEVIVVAYDDAGIELNRATVNIH